jgi:eukaryotic-like serine/threonine-protein kinase
MAESRWDLLQRLFAELLVAPASERASRLREFDRTDPALGAELVALLRAAEAPANPLDTPPVLDPAWSAAADGPFTPGMRVGAYELVRLVGEGGMGWVWLAERTDGAMKRTVALKLPKWSWTFPDVAARLARERDILASLEHANIARLYDAGVDELGRPYLAMEYVEGQPIDLYCREQRLTLDDRLRLLLQVAHAVGYAHSRLVVHRDLKPSNIVVAGDGTVHLLDFGIATLLDGEVTTGQGAGSSLTRVFTLRYAAPEQITGGVIGTSTDVYSLGLVLFELLTGTSPYRVARDSAAALEEAIVAGDTRLASAATGDRTAARHLRGDLDAVLNKALKSHPAERYVSIGAFADDLERYLKHETVSARPDSAAYRLRTFARRHRAGVGAAALVALTLAGATAYSTRQAAIASREAQRATAIKDFLLEVFQQASAKASLHSEPQNLRVIQVIDEGRDRLVTSLAGQPEVQMEVIAVLGDIYELLDATDRAAAVFQQGLVIANDAFGPGGPHSAEMMGAMANAAAFAGDFTAAEGHVRSAEAAFAALGDHESLAYARTLKVKGSLARRRGPEGLRHAVAILGEAAALFARRFPRDSNHSATYMYLAQTHMALDEPGEALSAAHASVAAADLLPPEDHLNRASAYSLRASVLDRVGESAQAERDYAQASADYLGSVGAEHFLYLQNENLRGLALQTLGRRTEALRALETSAEAIARVRPNSNTEVNTWLRMAVAYERDGQNANAQSAALKGVTIARAAGPGAPAALLSALLTREARARMLQGDLDGAERIAQDAIESARSGNALSPQIEADASVVLGEIAVARHDLPLGLRMAHRALPLSAGDSFAARVRRARAMLLEATATAAPEGALALAQSALALLGTLPAPGDPFLLAEVLERIGGLQCAAGDRPRGRAALGQARAIRDSHQDPTSGAVTSTAALLARCVP